MNEAWTKPPCDEGPLESTSVPALLTCAWNQRRTGALQLARGKAECRIQVRDGSPVAVESSRAEDTFARLLEETGQITAADRLKIERFASEHECPQASAVLALRLLDAKTLYHAIRSETRNRLCETFEWQTGVYRWIPLPDDEAANAKPLDVLQLLQDQLPKRWGSERLFEALMQVSDQCGDIAPRYRRVAAKLASTGDLARRAIARLDGSVPIGRILGECAGDPLAASTLWLLLHAGILRVGGKPAAGADLSNLEFEVEVAVRGSGDVAPAQETDRSTASSAGDAKSQTLRSEIEDHSARLSELDHYTALGLDSDANAADIKKAYFKAAKKYHPDSLARMGLGDLKEEAARVFARMAEAFEVLSDSSKRAAYDKRGRDVPEIDMSRLAQAEKSFRKGEILLRMGNFGGALEYLEPAVDLWPEEPAYQSALGWALYKQSRPDVARAVEHLETALAQASNDPIIHYRLGVVMRAHGETERAQALIARAQALDPSLES